MREDIHQEIYEGLQEENNPAEKVKQATQSLSSIEVSNEGSYYITVVENISKNKKQNIIDLKDSLTSFNKRIWSADEDLLLLELTSKETKHNWKKLAKSFINKTPQQICYRHSKLISIENKKWNRNEDILLVELMEIYGRHWQAISIKMPGRSPKDLKERFEMKLDPNLKRGKFEKEEDELIIELYSKYGNQWTIMSKYFKNRNALMIKNRYYSHIKQKPSNKDTCSITSNKNYTPSAKVSHDQNKNSFTEHPNEALNKSSPEIIIEKLPFFSKKSHTNEHNSIGADFNYEHMLIDESLHNTFNSVSFDIPDLDKINLSLEKFSDVSKETSSVKGEHLKDDRRFNNFYRNDVYLDESESNNIPTDYFKMETDSPKCSFAKEYTIEHFDDHYKNAFISKNNSFALDDETQKKNLAQNNNYFNNEVLLTQYKKLEEIFSSVKDLSLNKNLTNTFLVDQKLTSLNKKLDEKRENLSHKLSRLKTEYFSIIQNGEKSNLNSETMKSSLIKQIETLMELIKTTKYKINLISNISKQETQ